MLKTTNEQVNRVSRGAALLDKVRPGWENEINLNDLDIGNNQNCVLGQLFGRFSDGLVYLDGISDFTIRNCVSRFGFDSDTLEGYSEQCAILNSLWAKEILDRLEKR